MPAKIIFGFFAQALLVQTIFSQCIGPMIDDYARFSMGPSLPYGPYPACPGPVAPTSGGGFLVQSSSPISPNGVSVISENAIEGTLSVIGELPFLGAISLEGALPTAGAGAINYGCGDGSIGIVSEGLGPAGYPAAAGYGSGVAPGAAYGPGFPGYGYGLGFNGIY